MKEIKGPISFSEPAGFIEQMDMDMLAVQQAQDLQAIKDEAERKQRRLAAYKKWSDPKEIKKRRRKQAKEAKKALERTKRNMGYELKVYPVPDPLPKEMQGQSPSTIQRMLAQMGVDPISKEKVGPFSFKFE